MQGIASSHMGQGTSYNRDALVDNRMIHVCHFLQPPVAACEVGKPRVVDGIVIAY